MYTFHYNLEEVEISGINLSNCEIKGIKIKIENLSWVIVSPIQILSLSKLLGLIQNIMI